MPQKQKVSIETNVTIIQDYINGCIGIREAARRAGVSHIIFFHCPLDGERFNIQLGGFFYGMCVCCTKEQYMTKASVSAIDVEWFRSKAPDLYLKSSIGILWVYVLVLGFPCVLANTAQKNVSRTNNYGQIGKPKKNIHLFTIFALVK